MTTHTISPQQKRIQTLFGDNMPVNTSIYCITGYINPTLLAECLQTAATRHSILNTSISTGANGSLPVQNVREQHNGPAFKIVHRRMKVAGVNTLLPLLSNDPAFCDRDCPLLAALVSSGPDTCYLILQCSPLLLDNWSLNLLVSETVARCHNQGFISGLPDTEVLQYPAYSDWQNENLRLLHTIPANMLQTLQQMQMPHLPDQAFITPAELHLKKEHSVTENVTTVLQQVLSALQLEEKAAPELLFCVWGLLQYRVSMENVQAVGWTDPCRDLPVVSNTLGVFTKVLPVRMEVAQGDNFLTLFEAVKTQLAEIREVKDYFSPGANAPQEESAVVTSPAYAFEYRHYLAERKGGIDVEQIYAEIVTEPAYCKLTVVTNAVGEKTACVTCRDNDGKVRAASLLTGFITLLKSIVQYPEKEINQLRIVSDDMLRELQTEAVPAVPTAYSSLVEAVKDHARNHGDRVAVVAGDVHLTYHALDSYADQLAGYLEENYHVSKGDIVGWYGAPTDQTMIAFLGISKAGAAYLPLNYLDPAERTSHVIRDSGMRLLLAQNESAQPVFSGVETLYLSDMQWLSDNRKADRLPASNDLAYVIYTSGSTGQPKGVMMEHGAVVNLCAGIRDRVITMPAEQTLFIAQQAPVFFDASVQQYGVSFFSGGTLFLIGDDMRKDPARLASFLLSRSIEIIDFTPGMFEVLLDEVVGNLANLQLKHILVAGESWSQTLIRKFRDSKAEPGSVKVSNIYGPTECCVDATYYNITAMPEEGRSLPIGHALPGYSVLLLNDALEPQLPGTPGEIYIGGKGVGRGYLNREELTGERFLDNPFAAGEKMYKTGDFGVRGKDGLLYFNGRKDNQVKIRGYRIELGEIEKALLRHTAVDDCIVLLDSQENEVQQLVAFYLSGAKVHSDTLRHYLEQQLPGYMVPNALVRMDQFPLNSSGKTDRKQLLAHFAKKDKAVRMTLLSEMETTLLNLCRDLLNMNNIGIDDNFFNAGGDSLKAMKLMSYIFKNLDSSIKLRDIFEFPVLSSLARKISVNRNGNPDLIPKVRDAAHYQLSSFQRRFWVLQNLLGEKIPNNIQNTYEAKDTFDEELLYQALKELTRRQEVLRTIFIQEDEVPFQKVLPPDQAIVHLEYRDLRQVPTPEALLAQVMEEEGKHIFRLDEAPLWRVLVFRSSDDRFIVGITMHHIIADQWSSALFIDQLQQLYHDLLLRIPFRMKELAIQYRDYAEWEQGRIVAGKHASDKAYWSDIFRGDVPALNLRIEHPRPRIKGYVSHAVSRLFETQTMIKLNEIARRSDTNVFATLFTIVSVLLYKYTGQQEMIIGFPAINRNRAEVKDLIGFFLNNLAVRCNMNGTDTVERILSANAKMIVDALEHAGYPYLEMVSELVNDRDLSRAPLFDVFVVYERIESPAPQQDANGGLQFEEGRLNEFDLTFNFKVYDDNVCLTLLYDPALFSLNAMVAMQGHCQHILNTVYAEAGKILNDVELLSAADKEKILHAFSPPLAAVTPKQQLVDCIEETMEKRPGSVVLVCGDSYFTAHFLSEKVHAMAYALQHDLQVAPGDLVGLFMGSSPEMVMSMMAIMKIGAAYVPLDVQSPDARIAVILQDTAMRVLLTDSANRQRASAFGINLQDVQDTAFASQSKVAGVAAITPESLCYVMYTSGSTGQPKGVAVKHQGLLNLLAHMQRELEISQHDRWLSATNYTFDISVLEIFLPLMSGIPLILCRNQDLGIKMTDIQKGIECGHATIFQATPTIWATLVAEHGNMVRKLKKALSGGEFLPVSLGETLFASIPRFWNVYGPTETTIWSASCRITGTADLGYIGTPITATAVYICNDQLQLMPVGVEGTIYISGAGVAAGYLNQPELTRKYFISDPFTPGTVVYNTGDRGYWSETGRLVFTGRKDRQVKIRGHRIELQEIRNTVLRYPGMQDAEVTTDNSNGTTKLFCYYVSNTGTDEEQLRAYLSSILPDYMIPAYFGKLPRIPLNASGKPDLKALPASKGGSRQQEQHEVVYTPQEIAVRKIWEAVLKVTDFGKHDSFFRMGGDSIRIIKLWNRMNEQFGRRVEMMDLFKYDTVEKQAALLTPDLGETILQESTGDQYGKKQPLFFLPPYGGISLIYDKLADRIKDVADPHLFYLKGLKAGEEPAASMEELIGYFCEKIGRSATGGECVLLGYSFGGLLAYETARMLEKKGFSVTVFIIDSFPQQHYSPEEDERAGLLEIEHAVNMLQEMYGREADAAVFIERYRRVLVAANRLFSQYQQGKEPVEGDVVNFTNPLSSSGDGALVTTWEQFAGGAYKEVTLKECDHMKVFEEAENVEMISRIIMRRCQYRQQEKDLSLPQKNIGNFL